MWPQIFSNASPVIVPLGGVVAKTSGTTSTPGSAVGGMEAGHRGLRAGVHVPQLLAGDDPEDARLVRPDRHQREVSTPVGLGENVFVSWSRPRAASRMASPRR